MRDVEEGIVRAIGGRRGDPVAGVDLTTCVEYEESIDGMRRGTRRDANRKANVPGPAWSWAGAGFRSASVDARRGE
jgi:hypothetical protein